MADVTDLKLERARKALRALNLIGDNLVAQATDLVPYDEGTLQGSFAVVLVVNGHRHEGDDALISAQRAAEGHVRAGTALWLEVEVSYNTVYAARQHEELDWHHDDGRQAKYLEQPFAANLPRYERIIGAAAS